MPIPIPKAPILSVRLGETKILEKPYLRGFHSRFFVLNTDSYLAKNHTKLPLS